MTEWDGTKERGRTKPLKMRERRIRNQEYRQQEKGREGCGAAEEGMSMEM
jgi:hypothetical protein